MAAATRVSKPTVQRLWTAFHIQPHRQQHFQLSTDPFFVEKVRDIVGLHLHPPNHALILCGNEKSQTQPLERIVSRDIPLASMRGPECRPMVSSRPNIPAVLALGITQQAVQVGRGPLAGLRPPEAGGQPRTTAGVRSSGAGRVARDMGGRAIARD